MTELMERHVFTPDIDGLCTYLNINMGICKGTLEEHLTQEQKDAMTARMDAALSKPLGERSRLHRMPQVSQNGPKVCECGNGLFKLDLHNGLIVLTCSACDEETEVPWGVLRGHLKEPE